MEEAEVWTDVPDYAGLYSISTHGRVRSEPRLVYEKSGKTRMSKQRILKCSVGGKGYLFASLVRDGAITRRYVHHVVLETFVGPRPPLHEGCHNDGNNRNNRLSNLRWDTKKANHADKNDHGTSPQGERHPMAKLTESDVIRLRARRAEGASFTVLAREFHVTRMTAYRAATNQSWSHI